MAPVPSMRRVASFIAKVMVLYGSALGLGML